MLILCDTSVYVYHTNGTNTGIKMSVCTNLGGQAYYMNFDSKDRLIITCQSGISIYY